MAARTLEDRVTALEGTVAGLQELPKQLASFQRDVAARFEQVDARFERLERIVRDGDERNYSQMRVLHEDLVTKIALLGERRDAQTDGRAVPNARP